MVNKLTLFLADQLLLNGVIEVDLCDTSHNDEEVCPNRHGQICPVCVSSFRFSYVNTLKCNNIAQNRYFSKKRQN